MAIEKITMPKLGESVTEGTISAWFVKVGDTVKKYEPLAEVQTDKVTAEIPSSYTGVIKELVAREGDTLAVGELICYIDTEENTTNTTSGKEGMKQDSQTMASVEKENEKSPNKYRYSPAVLKMSQQFGIDLEQVKGTGKGGRITRKDLQKLLDSDNQSIKSEVSSNLKVKNDGAAKLDVLKKIEPNSINQYSHGDQKIRVTNVRKVIAENLHRSKHEIPHAWMMVEADVTNLVAFRNSIKEEFKKKEGFPLTYFPFFVKAVATALKEYPMMNSTWAGDSIIQKKEINLSIAVATEDALYVPVIKHADEKSIKGLAKEINELAKKVRSGNLTPDDVQGGTFTVNNTGSFGSIQSMGIINYPQAAILQVESIVKRPVIMNDNMFAARDIVNLCLSLDHRILDGLICGRFLARVKQILENISKENTSLF